MNNQIIFRIFDIIFYNGNQQKISKGIGRFCWYLYIYTILTYFLVKRKTDL